MSNASNKQSVRAGTKRSSPISTDATTGEFARLEGRVAGGA